MTHAGQDWGAEEISFLRHAREVEGLSLSQIASQLPGRTRAAVSGMVNRLDLTRRVQANCQVKQPALTRHIIGRSNKIEAGRNPPPPVPVVASTDGSNRVLLEKVQEGQCRYPLWDNNAHPASEEMFYCGNATLPNSSWCSSCAARVFNPLPTRRELEFRRARQ